MLLDYRGVIRVIVKINIFSVFVGIRNVFGDELNDFTGSISSSIQKLQDKHPDLDLFIEQINKMLVEK